MLLLLLLLLPLLLLLLLPLPLLLLLLPLPLLPSNARYFYSQVEIPLASVYAVQYIFTQLEILQRSLKSGSVPHCSIMLYTKLSEFAQANHPPSIQ